MAALPYMQLYVADYLADTQHLSLEEHGAYLLIIFNYWQRGKAPADDNKRFASICSTDVQRWLEIRSALVEFFEVKDGVWIHHRIEKDLEKVRRKSDQAALAGKASAAARSAKPGETNGRSNPVERGSNHTDTDTDTKKEKELSDKSDLTDYYLTAKKKKLSGKRLESFNRFWESFAYKLSKAEAADAWLAIPSLTEAVVVRICDAAGKEAERRKEIQSKGLTPIMAQGWLTKRRWEDEDGTATGSGKQNCKDCNYRLIGACKQEKPDCKSFSRVA